MATLPPRKNPTPTRLSKQHLTPLQILLQMGFPKHRAEKALAATGNRGVQLASDWLLAHVNDPFLDECAPREYILYACPTGPFLKQLEEFWKKSKDLCGWNGAHNFVPHITLVSFFKAPDECAPALSKALKQIVDLAGAQLDRPLNLEMYTSQNFMGFFVTEEDANYLKRLALQYVKEVSTSIISDTYEQLDALVACFPWCGGVTSNTRCIPRSSRSISLEPHVKSLHLTLAYQFPSNQFNPLKSLVETLIPTCTSGWELRLYSRDPRLASKQVHKVLYPHNPREPDEVELRIGDHIYMNSDALQNSTDGWVEGVSWLTGITGYLPENYTERTAESDAWTMHRTIQLYKTTNTILSDDHPQELIDSVDGGSSIAVTANSMGGASGGGSADAVGDIAGNVSEMGTTCTDTITLSSSMKLLSEQCNDLPLTTLPPPPQSLQAHDGGNTNGQSTKSEQQKQYHQTVQSIQPSQQNGNSSNTKPTLTDDILATGNAVELSKLLKTTPIFDLSASSSSASANGKQDTAVDDNNGTNINNAIDDTRKMYIMRHGERVDFTFGLWIPFCFDEYGNYKRKDLNMPKSLPIRRNSPAAWENDSPLSNIGYYQAIMVGDAMKECDVKIDNVYCSPSYRCIQTCLGVLEGLGVVDKLSIRIEPGIFEWMSWHPDGVPEWCTTDELLSTNFNIDTNYVPCMTAEQLADAKNETAEEFYHRNHTVVEKILNEQDGNIILVGHAATLDSCTRALTGNDLRTNNEMSRVMQKIPYCSLAVVEQKNDGNWQLIEPPCEPVTHTRNTRFDWKILIS